MPLDVVNRFSFSVNAVYSKDVETSLGVVVRSCGLLSEIIRDGGGSVD